MSWFKSRKRLLENSKENEKNWRMLPDCRFQRIHYDVDNVDNVAKVDIVDNVANASNASNFIICSSQWSFILMGILLLM